MTGTTSRFPALDGLRGVAVLLVLGFHAGLPGLQGGFLGVSMFFTLSGFLITRLLLTETDTTGRIGLGSFWVRRARRLLPASLLCLTAVGMLAPNIGRDLIGAVLYAANWNQLTQHENYTTLFLTRPLLTHFWSLAVEEQFYLLWPVLLWAAIRRYGTPRGPILALGLSWIVVVFGYAAAYGTDQRVYLGSDTRAAEILAGAVLAVVVQARPTLPLRRSTQLAAAAAAVAVIGAVTFTSISSRWVYSGGLVPFAALNAALIAGSLAAGPVSALLRWRALRRCGAISYGLYLYHWPLFVLIGTDTPAELAVSVTATVAAAALSYVLVERPLRAEKVHGPLFAAACVGVSAALVFGPGLHGLAPTRKPCYFGHLCPPIGAERLTAPVPADDPTDPARTAPVRLLVIGDSVSQVTAWGLNRSQAAKAGELAVVGIGTAACPVAGDGLRWEEDDPEDMRSAACDVDAMTATIRSYRPDVVLAAFTLSNQATVRINSRWGDVTDPFVQDAYLRAMNGIADTAAAVGAVLLWADAPARVITSGPLRAASGRADVHNALISRFLAAHHLDVVAFPLRERYDALALTSFVDGVHLSRDAAVVAADDWEAAAVLAAARHG